MIADFLPHAEALDVEPERAAERVHAFHGQAGPLDDLVASIARPAVAGTADDAWERLARQGASRQLASNSQVSQPSVHLGLLGRERRSGRGRAWAVPRCDVPDPCDFARPLGLRTHVWSFLP